MKNSFILYKDNFEAIQILSLEQRGSLLTAIYHFVTTGEDIELEPIVKVLFVTIKTHLQKDKDKWDNEVEKRREAGRLGGVAKASKCQQVPQGAKQNLAKLAVFDSVCVCDSVIVNEKKDNTLAGSDKIAPQQKQLKIVFNPLAYEFENISSKDIELWRSAYPAINLNSELNAMCAWLKANPANKKSNYDKFITNWLKRSQDKARRV